MRYRAISAAILAAAFTLPVTAAASAAPAEDQSVELILQGNDAFAYLYRSYLNDSDWTDISTDGGSTWRGPLGKVTNTWGGNTGMTSEYVHVASGEWIRACAHYASAFHCTPWRRV
jgi:hypothetical protein